MDSKKTAVQAKNMNEPNENSTNNNLITMNDTVAEAFSAYESCSSEDQSVLSEDESRILEEAVAL